MAMMIELNCCEIWLTGLVNCRESCKNEIIAPSESAVLPLMASRPPAMARNAYCRLPKLLLIGPRMLENWLALVAFSHRSSFRMSNSSFVSSSWQKTFTTFWPLIISSMKPFSVPSDCCWERKKRPASPPTLRVTIIMMASESSVHSVSQKLVLSMATNTTMMLMTEEMSEGMDCEIICRSVSASFVKWLMMSPCAWMSKYFTGRRCMLRNMSSRMRLSVFCATSAMM